MNREVAQSASASGSGGRFVKIIMGIIENEATYLKTLKLPILSQSFPINRAEITVQSPPAI
jgi:hypothetical protein